MKAKIWHKSKWLCFSNEITDQTNKILVKQFTHDLEKSGFTILHHIGLDFDPVGYSAIWLLAESHFALHTFPEEKKVYVELSSCNKDYFDRFCKLLKELKNE